MRGTPVGGAEPAHVDPAGRRRQDEVANQLRFFERRPDGEDAAHRLRDEVDGPVDPPQHRGEEVVEALDARIGRVRAEARPAEQHLLSRVPNPIGDRLPEITLAARARKKEHALGLPRHLDHCAKNIIPFPTDGLAIRTTVDRSIEPAAGQDVERRHFRNQSCCRSLLPHQQRHAGKLPRGYLPTASPWMGW